MKLLSKLSAAFKAVADFFVIPEIPLDVRQKLVSDFDYRVETEIKPYVVPGPYGGGGGVYSYYNIFSPDGELVNAAWTEPEVQQQFEADVRKAYIDCGLDLPEKIPGSEYACSDHKVNVSTPTQTPE